MQKEMLYEVETRVYFDNEEEAFNTLPFLKECLKVRTEWETRMYGIELFKSDIMLRTNKVKKDGIPNFSWGYKGPATGRLYNVRKELDEDITSGIRDSYIVELLNGKSKDINGENAGRLLEALGYKEFMMFTGFNLTGYHEKLRIAFKLMSCPVLRYPLMLEIEKSAETLEEAVLRETELKNFIDKYKLAGRVVLEEPTHLLYKKLQL